MTDKITIERETLQDAMAALEYLLDASPVMTTKHRDAYSTAARLRAALAQAAQPAPAAVPLTDEQDRALCEAHCNDASDEYFGARPKIDSAVNRRIFHAGHRKGWLAVLAAAGEKP